ncbi:MAG TPA: cupredoxin domain-containing protein [Thermoleophilaceae bacterium]
MRRGLSLAALVGALALAIAGASAAGAPKPRTVKVGDDYYSPVKFTVKKGTKIHWTWLAANSDTHDVRLKSGPKGVKKFKSELAASDYSFNKKLTVPGTYKIYCSLHKEMTETIVVKH